MDKVLKVPGIGNWVKESLYRPTGYISDSVSKLLMKRYFSRFEHRLLKSVEVGKGFKVLLIGIGNGNGLQELIEKAKMNEAVVFAIDRIGCRQMRAAKRFKKVVENGNLCIFHEFLSPSFLPDDWIDLVVHLMYYPFWSSDSRSSIEQLCRIMKPESRLIAGMDIKRNFQSRTSVFPYVGVAEYLKLLDEAGFRDVHVKYGQNGIDLIKANAASKYEKMMFDRLESKYVPISIFVYISSVLAFHLFSSSMSEPMARVSEYALSPGLVRPGIDDPHLFNRIVHNSRNSHDQFEMCLGELNRSWHSNSRIYRNEESAHLVLRAKRLMSIESIVLVVPFDENQNGIGCAAAVTLALNFASKNYWSKDLILVLVKNRRSLLHWLQGYHGFRGFIGDRGGACLAALVLDFGDDLNDEIHISVADRNVFLRDLPNMDLIVSTLQNCMTHSSLDHYSSLFDCEVEEANPFGVIRALLDPHKSYHTILNEFRVEALSLRLVSGSNEHKRRNRAIALLHIIEAQLRSLNNLAERFHQSAFLYVPTNKHYFISAARMSAVIAGLSSPLLLKLLIHSNPKKRHPLNTAKFMILTILASALIWTAMFDMMIGLVVNALAGASVLVIECARLAFRKLNIA